MAISNEEDLGAALKEEQDIIEIEGNLKDKVIPDLVKHRS